MKKKFLEHQTHGRWVLQPIDWANQLILLKIVRFLPIPAPLKFPRKMIRHGVELSLIYSFSSPDLRRSLSESHLLQNCNPGGENENDKKNSADTILR